MESEPPLERGKSFLLETSLKDWRRVARVMQRDDASMQVLKLHLFTEFYLNACIAAYLRTDQTNIDGIRLRYLQKIEILKLSQILDLECCKMLTVLNALRNKLAHRLEYEISKEDRRTFLGQKFAKTIPGIDEGSVFHRLTPALMGYLNASLQLVKQANEKRAQSKSTPRTRS